MDCHDTFPADVIRVEVPQQKQKPEIMMLCRAGGERLCQQALLDQLALVDPYHKARCIAACTNSHPEALSLLVAIIQ